MDQIVTAIAQKLGIPEAVFRSGLAVLLGSAHETENKAR
jgi:hypothetical protein